jgi:hypothetical protein
LWELEVLFPRRLGGALLGLGDRRVLVDVLLLGDRMAFIISSVTARRTALSFSVPAQWEKSRGSPKRMVTGWMLGMTLPGGCTSNVPIIAQGMTGTPAFSAVTATPTLPL